MYCEQIKLIKKNCRIATQSCIFNFTMLRCLANIFFSSISPFRQISKLNIPIENEHNADLVLRYDFKAKMQF